jgi:hypothetical protein
MSSLEARERAEYERQVLRRLRQRLLERDPVFEYGGKPSSLARATATRLYRSRRIF